MKANISMWTSNDRRTHSWHLRIVSSERAQNHRFLWGARKNTELMRLFQLRKSLWNVCQRQRKKFSVCMAVVRVLTFCSSLHTESVTLVPESMRLQQAVNNTFSKRSYSFTRWVFVGVKFSLRSDDICTQWQHCLSGQSRVFFLFQLVSPAPDIRANVILLSVSCFAILKKG